MKNFLALFVLLCSFAASAVIKDADYNAARGILITAGSKSAEKSHVKHTGKAGSPDGHGTARLHEATTEFGATPTAAQTKALAKAAKKMGIAVP